MIRQELKDLGVNEGQWYNEAVASREGEPYVVKHLTGSLMDRLVRL